MDWENYYLEFEQKARKEGKDKEYINHWLGYAKRLHSNGVPIIYNQEHFCQLVGYKKEYVYTVSNSPQHFYRNYIIKKKNGGNREISEPLPSLKEIQRWILDNILQKMHVSVYAKAYIIKKSIKENAKFHKKQKILLSLDVEKFFDSISSKKVYEVFLNVGYSKDVAVILTNICCLNGCLPQGAPTSPILSNIILFEFDNKIGNYTKEKKIRYTRYADDMSFSGDFEPSEVIRYVKKNLKELGLKLNKSKTRTRKQHQRQEVTGIVVNEKMQLSKEVRRKIRQEIYYIKKYGVESHQEYCGIKEANYLSHLKGIIQYGLFINPKDKELLESIEFLKNRYGNYTRQ